MNRLVIVLASWVAAALGCNGGGEIDSSPDLAIVDKAKEAEARAAAARPLEEQPPEVLLRYQEGRRRARQRMIEHARRRVDELERARQTSSKRSTEPETATSKMATGVELAQALELAQQHLHEVEQDLGQEGVSRAAAARP